MTPLRRLLAATLIISITGMGLPLPVQAGMLPTQSALAGASAARERLANLLERRDVRAQLEAYALNPADVSARVGALSDNEAAQLASRMDQLPAGGDGVGAVVGALLLVFIILLITDILGFTHVFPFTKPIKR
jgi:uncharacterized protein DUF6627